MHKLKCLLATGWIVTNLTVWSYAQFGARTALPQLNPQSGFYTPSASGVPAIEELTFERELLALDLAKTAAENGSQALSLDAFKRFVDNYSNKFTAPTPPPRGMQTTGIQSSLLGTPAADPFGAQVINGQVISGNPFGGQIVSGGMTQNFFVDPEALLSQMFALVQTWKTAKFDAGKVTEALQAAVLPSQNPKTVRSFPVGLRQDGQAIPRTITTTTTGPNGTITSSTTVMVQSSSTVRQPAGQVGVQSNARFRSPKYNQALGLYLIDWATAADRLEPLLAELEKRAAHPEGQEAHALIVYGRRNQGRPDLAGTYIASLLDQNKLSTGQWELIAQAATQPLSKDVAEGTFNEQIVANQQLAPDLMIRFLQSGLRTDLIAIAPYYHQLIRRAIQTEDIKSLNELVPPYIRQLEINGNFNNGSPAIESNVWTEVINECYRTKQPYMALKALQYVQERSPAQTSPAPPTREEARLGALLALCELPTEKRMTVTRSLVLDGRIDSRGVFQFCTFPESSAPYYFRDASWQSAARLLQADPNSSTISLLDVLLSDAEATGTLNETIDKLFAQLPEEYLGSADSSRLLCEWIRMRSDVREQPIPARIVTESQKYSYNSEFEQWYKNSPEQVRQTLAMHYRRQPDSPEAKLVANLEFTERMPNKQATEEPDRWTSTVALKHWLNIQVPEPPNSQAFAGHNYPALPWHISEKRQLRAPFSSAALMFKYPLQGNYALRCKITNSGDDWNNNSFGGIINGTFLEYRGRSQSGARVTLAALNGRLTSSLNSAFRINDNLEKTPTVDIECSYQDKRVALSINGKSLAHSEFTSSSYPFTGLIPLLIAAEQGSIELTGNPEIPKQVNLLDSSFSGWSARRYDRLLTNVIQLRPIDQPPAIENPSPSQLASWKLEDGELHSEGTFAAVNTEDPQVKVRKTHNCMLYARPLLDGERFDYEVWQDNNTPLAAPVIGLTALLIEEGKIRLHWLPTAREVQQAGIAVDNRADDPQAEQLGEAKIIDSQWNKVSLRVEGNRIILNINGSDVYRRPIPENSTTEFGWLSIPDQPTIRIRHATLSGNWPDKLPTDLWEMK